MNGPRNLGMNLLSMSFYSAQQIDSTAWLLRTTPGWTAVVVAVYVFIAGLAVFLSLRTIAMERKRVLGLFINLPRQVVQQEMERLRQSNEAEDDLTEAAGHPMPRPHGAHRLSRPNRPPHRPAADAAPYGRTRPMPHQ
ncbi:hypothetical protein PAPYR_9429 [Paratrimastix pyriformis]|uniref:Uncharacterized protein n=1 Tax=Paratrimastix pyriformis TaxID=342808 RepID=A0ABQ8UFH7_9EUKA|nr:hypothetical protein PAPYR_9429 [Paratrimastix pyriformis]